MLRVDRALSNAAYTYITRHSFDEWAISRGLASGQPDTVAPAGSRPAGPGRAMQPKPRTRLRDQEDAILAEIRKQGFVPEALPKNPSGLPGVKSAVRNALHGPAPFDAKTAFEDAWERLRKDRRIVDKA